MTYYVTISKEKNSTFYDFTICKHGSDKRIYQVWTDKRTGLIYAEAALPDGAKLKVRDKTAA